MTGTLFARLTASTDELHRRTLQHPTVLGIGDGSLPEATFRFYIEQDYQYLLRYVRVMALALTASGSLHTMTRFADLLHTTLAVEMGALRSLYESFGGDPKALESISPAPSCAAYSNHLLTVAYQQNLLLTVAAMLPCQWGYREIGHSLKAKGLPADQRYAAWIEEYADEAYGELVDWMIATLDHLAFNAGQTEIERSFEIFRISAEYEYRFWEMAWNRETW